MHDERDVRAQKLARNEFSRRGIDISRADLQVRHGILTVRGVIGVPHSIQHDDFKHEMELIQRMLRSRPDFRDVVIDAIFMG